MDAIDAILDQWKRERPDLAVGPMGLFGRLARVRARLLREFDTVFSEFGLNHASFDMLATLRRSGAPFRLLPGDLLAQCMVTSGTITHRITLLQKAGLVAREPNPDDGRSAYVVLTQEGLRLVDRAVAAHVAKQHEMAALLSSDEQAQLNALLRHFLAALDGKEKGG